MVNGSVALITRESPFAIDLIPAYAPRSGIMFNVSPDHTRLDRPGCP